MDHDMHRWQASEADSKTYRRSVVGAERFVDFDDRYLRGQRNIIAGYDICFTDPVRPLDVLRAARQVWTDLRFSVPTIAVRPGVDAADERMLVYRVAEDAAEAAAWAERTVRPLEAKTWREAHDILSKRRLPTDAGDYTSFYLASRTPTEYLFVLITDHTLFDGAGVKGLTHRFLTTFARYIGDEALARQELGALRWGQEHSNLLPAFPQILKDETSLSGPQQEAMVEQILQELQQTLPNAHTYKARSVVEGPDIAGTLEYELTQAESDRILQYGRAHGFTLNELVHAAVNLSVLHDNPFPAEDAVFVCLGVIDLRNQLRSPYSARHGYLGLCLGTSAFAVRAANIAAVAPHAQFDAMVAALKRVYAKQRSWPGLLAASAAIIDPLIDAAKAGSPPPTTSPFCVGDGKLERDMDISFKDAAGREVLHVAGLHASIRQVDATHCYRCWSLRGRLVISVDYNGAVWPKAVMQGFMEDVVGILRFPGEKVGNERLYRL